MVDEMGTFRVDVEIENPARPGKRQLVRNVLVDTGLKLGINLDKPQRARKVGNEFTG